VSVTGIVLAGGRSRRFGGSKLDEELDGTPILARAIHAVASIADEVLVAGPGLPRVARRAKGAGPGVRLVVDEEPFAGPLVALAGALDQATGAAAIVVGGDMPRLEPEVLRAMVERLATASVEAVILEPPGERGVEPRREPGRRQVFPLALDVGMGVRAAQEVLRGGDRSLQAMLDRLDVVRIPLAEWSLLDPAGATLLDVDTRADLDRIRSSGRGPELA
jgi:molybdopterin-guanine dinucleotide biosynthesis protein A